jgi:hypothetical protein
MINTSIPIFGELVDRLQLSVFTYSKVGQEEESSTPKATLKVGYGCRVHTVH